jgi:hypothetical protein
MAGTTLNISNKADTTGITLFNKPKLSGDG